MQQASIFKPDNVGYKAEFHTHQATYGTLKAVTSNDTFIGCIFYDKITIDP